MPQNIFGVAADGGRSATPHLTKMLRYQAQPLMRCRAAVEPIEGGAGKGRGDTVLFNKIGNVVDANGTAITGGSLSETATITGGKAPWRQGSVVMTEYGLKIDFTGKLQALSQYDIEEVVKTTLANDNAKVLNSAAGVQFTSGGIRYSPNAASTGTLTTDGTFAATASFAPTADHHREIIDNMHTRNIPHYAGEDFLCIASVNWLSGIRNDMEGIMAYTDQGVNAMKGIGLYAYPGEQGRFYGCRFVQDNQFLLNTVGTSSNKGQALYIGKDAVCEAMAIPEEVRTKVPLDFGRDLGMAWYYLGGFVTKWTQAVDSEDHVVFAGSL